MCLAVVQALVLGCNHRLPQLATVTEGNVPCVD